LQTDAPDLTNAWQQHVALCCAGFDNIEPWVGWDNNVINIYFNKYLPFTVRASAAAIKPVAIMARERHTQRAGTGCPPSEPRLCFSGRTRDAGQIRSTCLIFACRD